MSELSMSAGWYRARRARPLVQCEYDGCEDMGMDRHHVDGNPLNNDLANIAVYCRRHHMTVDGRLEAARARAAAVGRTSGGRPRGSTPVTDAAEAFLIEQLSGAGRVPSKTLRAHAEAAGFGWEAVKIARNRLSIRITRDAERWYWEMVA